VLIRDGVVLEDALRTEGIDDDDLNAGLRRQGVLYPSEVRLAMLETDGSISVVAKHPEHETTAADD
jgi:uncharacterized membrane protein YcaP (DUF421 family)